MSGKEKSPHAGHRRRVKEEVLLRGLEGLPEHRVLELLLFYAIPQGDTNVLAHRLIDRFGSLAGVLDARWEDLCAVPGVGEHTALLLHVLPGLCARYVTCRSSMGELIQNTKQIYEVMHPYFFSLTNEELWLMCLDGKRKVLGVRRIGEGSVNSVEVTARRVSEEALSLRASAVVLAHNHTSGIAVPSKADMEVTRYLRDVLAPIGIELLDHVIFCFDDMVSMRDSGML